MAIEVNSEPVRYDLVPAEHMREGLERYIEHGLLGHGSFLEALLSNDLMLACSRADHINQYRLFDWCAWLYNYAPSGSYGSAENVANWKKHRREALNEERTKSSTGGGIDPIPTATEG